MVHAGASNRFTCEAKMYPRVYVLVVLMQYLIVQMPASAASGVLNTDFENRLFTFHSQVNRLHKRLSDEFLAHLQNAHQGGGRTPAEVQIITQSDRRILMPILMQYSKLFAEFQKHVSNYPLNPYCTSRKNFLKIAAKTLYYGASIEFLAKITSIPGIGGIFNESFEQFQIPDYFFRKLIKKTLLQTWEGKLRQNREMPAPGNELGELEHLYLMDYWRYFNQFSPLLQKAELSQELKNLVLEYLSKLQQFETVLRKNYHDHIGIQTTPGGFLYTCKTFFFNLFKDIHIPYTSKISKGEIQKILELLQPGDIALVGTKWRLSNTIFFENGVTHAVLHIAPYGHFVDFFTKDRETNIFYNNLCEKKHLECTNYIEYMNEVHPKAMQQYKKTFHRGKPVLALESVASGVTLSTSRQAYQNRNTILAFRPNLRKVDIAMAVAEAFSNLGKAYDFNFDARTYDKVTCTEIILYAYATEPTSNKRGIDWVTRTKPYGGAPTMMAADVYYTSQKNENLLLIGRFE